MEAGDLVWMRGTSGSIIPSMMPKSATHPREYPLSFLDRMNSPEKLDAQLDSDLKNDFTKTGVFNREELDENIFRDRPITV